MSKTQQIKHPSNDPSLQSKKDDLKKIGDNIIIMKNRVGLLKQQLQKQKDHIQKNKQLIKFTMQKKLQVNRINKYKQKDTSKQQKKIQILKQKNKISRINHQQQLTNIQKAIYLVKLDDARQSKNISLQNQKKINNMEKYFLQENKSHKNKIFEQSIEGKKKYNLYFKDKLTAIHHQQAQSMADVQYKTQVRKQQLKQLEIQQLQLMDQISKYHTQHVQSKKQYLSALKLPAKNVKQQRQTSQPKSSKTRKNRGSSHRSRLSQNTSPQRDLDEPPLKIPNAFVNQAKLRLVLKQLKKAPNDTEQQIFSHRQKR